MFEFKFPRNTVHNQKCLRLRIQGQRLYGLGGYGASGGQGPFLNLMMEFFHNVVSPVNGRRIKHPSLFGLRSRLHPLVEQFVCIYRKFFLIQRLCQNRRTGAYPAGRHGSITEENRLQILLLCLLAIFFMYLGKRRLICPCQGTFFIPLVQFLHQVFLCDGLSSPVSAVAVYLKRRFQQRPDFSVLLLFQTLRQYRCILFAVPSCQHTDGDLPFPGLFGCQQLQNILFPVFLPVEHLQQFFFHRLGSVLGKSENHRLIFFR